MPAIVDLTGQRFGRLVVIERANSTKGGAACWLCECDCGNKTISVGADLRRGRILSCGCLHSEIQSSIMTKHGYGTTRLAYIWRSMIRRCYNRNDKSFLNYGGRGIEVCKEWKNSFLAFQRWALSNGYAEDLTIDREDTNGNYEPLNCRWVTMKVQQNNRRNNHLITFGTESRTLAEWGDVTGIAPYTIRNRIEKGWEVQRALTEPTHKKT